MQAVTIIYAVLCVFGAAIVRGYSGFGFSLLSITSLSLLLPPAQVVPSIFMMEVAASLRLLPHVWKDIHWHAILWLAIGCFVATPIGVWALANVPSEPLTVAMAIFVLAAAILLARGFVLHKMPGRVATFAAGAASGLCNGGFGIGGPPVILFFFSSPAGVAVGRASLIAFFVYTDIMGLAWQGWNGLLTWNALWRALIFLPPLFAGIWLGHRSFKTADPEVFRRWVLRLLMLLAVLTGGQALYLMMHHPVP
ncbi:MAG TPA: sulfite exporter TauE/SafE family protein [Candidatus Polarisedimenticolia bacterium]|nr:sulfite exporter TauE/SafE family protein [Candidatus Polarisedimenticolia bacterium]